MSAGRELWVIAIAAELPDEHVWLRPELKYIANMHGDEVGPIRHLIMT